MVRVRPIQSADGPWVVGRLVDAFGGVVVARKGVLIDASALPGFVATDGKRPVGLLTHDVADGECEVVAVLSTERGLGVGRALMDAARDHAEAAGCRRLWLVTTNDNARAFRFYQRWGMDLSAFHRHGARRSREAKPSLPLLGADGIPIEHELEFELELGVRRSPSGSRATGPNF
jgi:ribosomal protein S18 acetylase RimI-like enzyme